MKKVSSLALLTLLTFGHTALATNHTGGQPTNPTTGGQPSGGGSALQNPLAVDSISELLVAILEILIVLAVPIIVIFIILAGFKFVTAQGNEQRLSEAKQALLYAIIGGVLIIGALAIAEIVKNLVEAF